MKVKAISHIFLFVSLILLSGGCSRATSENPTLIHAAYLLDNEPDSAKKSLDLLLSIDTLSLDRKTRIKTKILVNKAQDKLFIPVYGKADLWEEIDFLSHDQDKDLYKEALYLQGRMESEKGDFLTAQQLYKESLETYSQNPHAGQLNAKTLWHLAYLSSKLNHHSDAFDYSERSYNQYREMKDTLGMAYALKIAGFSLYRLQKFDEAVVKLDSATRLMEKISMKTDQVLLYTADARLRQGNLPEALNIIRKISLSSDTLIQNNLYSIALNIYDTANKPDSAILYAKLLINSHNANNRCEAYRLLTSPRYRGYVTQDSLSLLLGEYHKALSDYLDSHEAEDFSYRTALFNYNDHLNARKSAESKSKNLLTIVLSLSSLLFLVLSIVGYLLYRNKAQALLCQELKNRILLLSANNPNSEKSIKLNNGIALSDSNISPKQLLEEFRQQVLQLHLSSAKFVPVSLQDKLLMESIHEFIYKKKPISRKSDFCKKIENSITESNPDFITNLGFITADRITGDEILLAILLKIGIRSTDIATLLGVEKNTVSYRKKTLLKKFNLEGVSTASLDRLILIL